MAINFVTTTRQPTLEEATQSFYSCMMQYVMELINITLGLMLQIGLITIHSRDFLQSISLLKNSKLTIQHQLYNY